MIKRGDNPSAEMCTLCEEAFTLPEDEVEGNLPRVLLCSHIYCTSCLLSIQSDDVIKCPECKVDSTLPEGGVFGLKEDSGIIGLIYTSKLNRKRRSSYRKKDESSPLKDINTNTEDVEQSTDIEKIRTAVDEALVQAAENHALLDKINETLKTGLTDQVKRDRARLESEITQAADKASQAIQKWKDEQISELTKLNARFSTGRVELCRVQKKMKALEIAMQMAREVRRVPFLEQYCTLDKVLETLQAPVDEQSFDVKCITLGSGLSSVFQIDCLKPSLALSLAIEVGDPKLLSEPPSSFNRKSSLQRAEGQDRNYNFPSGNDLPTHPKQNQESPKSRSPLSRGSSPIPLGSSNRPRQNDTSHSIDPDVIIEELYKQQQHAPQPTGPELASDVGRIQRKKINQSFGNQADFLQMVIVTHIVNPSHFYVRYEAENSESENLSEKINVFCSRDSCHFTSSDKVENGSLIFAKSKEGLWCRASVVSVLQIGRADAGKDCPVTQLASVRVFFLDSGLNIRLPIQREEGSTESSLQEVNTQLRKVYEGVNRVLSNFAPQAIRCSLKDLVPYDLTKGWEKDAQVKFSRMVGSAAVDMRHKGQDRDTLLVDLNKVPVNQSSGNPISVREYLVLNEVARYYAPVNLGMRTLLFYPPEYPKVDTEVNAVVSHINTPTDFYIQVVENMESLLLFAKLQDCYNATMMSGDEDFNIYCPVMEQSCVARFKGKLWYRAQIIGNPAGKKVEVQYVDFGIKKILSVSDLRKIKDEFFALPSMAIHCCLSEIIPLDGNTWSETCCNRFVSLAQDKLVTIVATGQPGSQPLPVKLFESSLNGPEANIATLLVKEELASFKDRSAPCRPKSLQETRGSSAEDSTDAIWDSPLELGLDTESVDTPEQKTPGDQTEEQPEFDAQLKLPDQLKDLKVRVSHVNSPSSFYIQLTQNDAQLKKICELVKKQCARMDAEDIMWKADIYCAAQIDGVWERGQICSDVESDNIAEVLRCDHGNKVKIQISDLRPLRPSLTGALALECTLTDIRPAGGRSTWTATACDLISFYLAGASAMVTIKKLTDEHPVPVILSCSNKTGRFVSIADFLVSEGLALRERKPRDVVVKKSEIKETEAPPPVSETQTKGSDVKGINTPPALPPSPLFFAATPISITTSPRPNSRTVMSAEKVKTPMYNPPELPCLGNIQINVSAIGEDGLIYTRTLNAECQLEQLRERIQQSMKTLPRQKPYTWKSVLGCAVIGPDMLWYRGQLLEVLGGHVKVQYVDYGLVENIPVVHVYPVLLCEDVPQLCMPCKLHSINPVGGRWQRDAVALLKELLLNRCVDMRVMELPSDPRDPLSVELFVDGLSLSRILCHHEHASMDQALSVNKEFTVMSARLLDDWDIDTEGLKGPEEPLLGPFIYPNLPQEGERIQVRVKHLWTPNELFLWPVDGADEVDGETLDEVLTRINSDLSSLQRLGNFRQGAPCLAEYRDGKYYRAELIKITSVEPVMILVKHVDFGSDDTLPPSKLRQMCAELMSFPSRALKVKVAGFKPPSKSRQQQQDVLPYSPAWSVKATMDMIDMLHGNITASVVAREPELTVLLYNEDEELVHLPLVSNGLAEFE
ncbi:RING finger protein 17 isoform X3 [Pseudochaenichthys georgianus]|uniref:RING finger protein 17 isoform X3 n=1 Tax=Pseudochaenichthys georgianus TaxID=52239 RepID=UPI00146B8A3C|nr:RING finger protein 17 isoform X3 [Pseudochaenichthys georgianus]